MTMSSRKNALPGAVDAERTDRHAEMLAGRLRKRHKQLSAKFERADIGAYRLYDRDIPEVRAVVDWYEGHLVLAEYERDQTSSGWLRRMGEAAAGALGLDASRVHLKRRRTRPKERGGARYAESSHLEVGDRMVVRESGARYLVELDGRLDVGLFLDHRPSRAWIRSAAEGCSVLNLFAYTGSFSVAALAGGARHVTSVDLSRTYLDWAQANLRENQLPLERHEPARKEAFEFLDGARRGGRRWHLIVVDPPSFSTTGGPEDRGLDIRRDHPALLEACLDVLAPGGTVLFSTNHQRFEPRLDGPLDGFEETTHETVPEDFRNRSAHRSFRFRS